MPERSMAANGPENLSKVSVAVAVEAVSHRWPPPGDPRVPGRREVGRT